MENEHGEGKERESSEGPEGGETFEESRECLGDGCDKRSVKERGESCRAEVVAVVVQA